MMTITRKPILFLMALMETVGSLRKSFKVVTGPDGVTPLCALDAPSAFIPWSAAAVGFLASSVPAVIGCGHSCTGYVGCISFNYRESQSIPAQCELYTSVPRNCSVATSSGVCQHYELSDSKRSCLARPANQALGLTAYQVSTYINQYASLAIDGKYDTVSCTTQGTNPWWAVDLGQAYEIQRVVVVNDVNLNYVDRLDNFGVVLSNDQPQQGNSAYNIWRWTLCAQYQGTVAAFGTASVVCSSTGTFRYVAVTGRKDAICLTEVSVFVEQSSTERATTISNGGATSQPV